VDIRLIYPAELWIVFRVPPIGRDVDRGQVMNKEKIACKTFDENEQHRQDENVTSDESAVTP